MNSELKEREEGHTVPDGWSYIDNTKIGGRIHLVYQWQDGNITRRVRCAFHGKMEEFKCNFAGGTEQYNNLTDEYRTGEF